MQIKILTLPQIDSIYKKYMVLDFPDSELKPLSSIHTLFNSSIYLCLGAYEEETLQAYAFFSATKAAFLLDYFATTPDCRGSGVGSKFINAIQNGEIIDKPIILEVESVASATTASEKLIRNRRISFYEKNGCVMSGAMAWLFGVEYSIMTWGFESKKTDEEIKSELNSFYRVIFPSDLYNKAVRLKP